MKTLDEIVIEAEKIMQAHSEAEDYDACFDAGEFSASAHDTMMEREIKQLAESNGFTFDQVIDEIMKRSNENVDAYEEHFGKNK